MRKRLFIPLVALCFGLICFQSISVGQSYKPKCDSISVCWGVDSFSMEFNTLFQSIKSDSLVAYTYSGGIGCHPIRAFIGFKNAGKFIIHYYNGEKIIMDAKLKKKDKVHIESFFKNRLYALNDTIPASQMWIDDGGWHELVYRVGSYCASYTYLPDVFTGGLYDWAVKVLSISNKPYRKKN